MKTRKNAERAPAVNGVAGMTELTDEEVGLVSGGTANIYYDVSTGTYILRDSSQVYVGPGILVGRT